MKILKLLDEKLEEVFLVIILIAAVVIVAMQVVTRYVFKIPLPWSEEIARYLFLWLTWVGASYATKERKHVSIDLVYEKLPEKGQMICKVITNIIWLVFLLGYYLISVLRIVFILRIRKVGIGKGLFLIRDLGKRLGM